MKRIPERAGKLAKKKKKENDRILQLWSDLIHLCHTSNALKYLRVLVEMAKEGNCSFKISVMNVFTYLF